MIYDTIIRKGRSVVLATLSALFLLTLTALWMTSADPVWAHCDTMAGPVVADAQKALSTKDVTSVLKWVRAEDEPVIREAFQKTLAARSASGEAREIADTYFFETLVRIHRAGEGEPFTGLKPASAVEPGIAMADRSIESGDIQPVVLEITEAITDKSKRLYDEVQELQKHKDETVEAGRAYVRAYVEYIHFVESVHALAAEKGGHHGAEEGAHQH